MHDTIKIFILAVLQGITEFLPVSSSGHLALACKILGLESPGASLEIFLHAGTLLAILIFYRKKIGGLVAGVLKLRRIALIEAGIILLSAVPAGILYVLAGDKLEAAYDAPRAIGAALCVTGVILIAGRFAAGMNSAKTPVVGPFRSLLIGMAQAVAMLPGISRSGTTISAARMLGVEASAAAEFSFIMSIPVLGGATLLGAIKAAGGSSSGVPVSGMLFGAAVSAVVGYISLASLVGLLKRGKFWWFGVYCFAAGVCAIIFF